MKKIILYILLAMAIPTGLMANPAKAKIYASNHQKIRVSIDGFVINKKPMREIRLDQINPGRHHARIEVFGRHGKKVIHDQIFVKKGFVSTFMVKAHYGRAQIVRTDLRPLHHANRYHRAPSPAYHPVINQQDFNRLVRRLEKTRFDGDRLFIIREELRYVSLYSEDVNYIMSFLTYESSRLDVAKFTYRRIVDKENIYLVYDGFRFNSTARELDRYLYRYPI